MRMRFCATMRSAAFSISALIAPVRLRAVASGLMIEQVRSIAMIFPWISADGRCGAYIGATRERQAILLVAPVSVVPPPRCELQQFHEDEPSLKPLSRFRSPAQA